MTFQGGSERVYLGAVAGSLHEVFMSVRERKATSCVGVSILLQFGCVSVAPHCFLLSSASGASWIAHCVGSRVLVLLGVIYLHSESAEGLAPPRKAKAQS